MSRELDEKVARVLEWPHVDVDDAQWKNWHMPGYSTDHACVPEMLAWLRCRFALVEIGVYKDGEVWARGSFDDVDTIDMESSGDTIPEALARLVVAVAEAKESDK